MGEERRKYYRYPANGGSDAVVVSHLGVERPARIVNLSSDGFRLDMNEESIVEVGDIVLMATSNGFHRVRVVNVSRDNGTLQLGLQRLQDVPASAVESQAEREGRPRRRRGLKASSSTALAQVAVPVVLGAMILGGVAWAWTTQSDPVGALVDERTFVTPTSSYNARRHRPAPDVEATTAPSEKQSRPTSGAVAGSGSDSTLWSPGARSATVTDSTSPRSNHTDEPGDLADAGPSMPHEIVGPAGPLFQPTANATVSLKAALNKANRENKHVLVEFGGNQCDSCSRLNAAFTQDAEIAAAFRKGFVLVLVDIDSNQNLVSQYVQDETQEKRVPFLALLNKEGKVLKRQPTDELSGGSRLDVGKVKQFLQQWSSAG
jgi:hypothetical protein